MYTLDSQLLVHLNDLPGWDALTSASAPAGSPEALDCSTTAVREAVAFDASRAMSADLIRSSTKSSSSALRRRTRWAVGSVAVAAAAALVIAAPTVSTPGNAPVSVVSASEFLTPRFDRERLARHRRRLLEGEVHRRQARPRRRPQSGTGAPVACGSPPATARSSRPTTVPPSSRCLPTWT